MSTVPEHVSDEPLREPEIGDVYVDKRSGNDLILLYVDSHIALLRDRDDHHRLERRRDFDASVSSGRFTLQPDAEQFGNTGNMALVREQLMEYENSGGRKESHYAEAMQEVLDILTDSRPEDASEPVEFEKVSGIGEATASALRAAGFHTRRDIRRATDNELLDISGIGEKSLNNLRSVVDD